MFPKQKNSGQIIAWGYADGRPQHKYLSKKDTQSPMNAMEILKLSCTINAEEQLDVETADIPGAFMQADMQCRYET